MSLRDQMLKAGLITDKEAKQAAHRQRVEKKRADPRQKAAETDTARREAQREMSAQKEQDRLRERERQAGRAHAEKQRQEVQRRDSAIAAIYREGSIRNWEGPRRYHFVLAGRIEFLSLTEEACRKLEKGQAAIVAGESAPQPLCLLSAGAARKLHEIAPERILAFHPDPGPNSQ